MDISQLIAKKDRLNPMTLRELRNLTERYPFYHTARLLYIANLYELHDPALSEELTKASVLVPDRTVLFNMIEGHNYQLEKNKPEEVVTENDENRTISLIDDFLSSVSGKDETKNDNPHSVPTIADLTNDYAAFLNMQDDLLPSDDSDSSQQVLIDSFIKANQGKQRYELEDDAREPVGPGQISDDEADMEAVFNENIVNIYIKQGRYQQALEILKSICLNNPEKSANFASQMRLLEIVVNNNKQ